ncbi:hypothetical protein D3C81_1986670 [compost metagenome]
MVLWGIGSAGNGERAADGTGAYRLCGAIGRRGALVAADAAPLAAVGRSSLRLAADHYADFNPQ